MNSDWKDGFLFVGNQLALDFLNTRPVQNGQALELLPDFNALLRWFVAAGLLPPADASAVEQQWGTTSRARRTLEAVWKLREELREEILSWESGNAVHRSTLDGLNRLMEEHPMHSRLTRTRNGVSMEQWFNTSQPENLLAPVAHSAARLFTEGPRDRVRKCGECVLHFLDTSKKGTRRWCSMQLCGNRLKVAAYAARKRKEIAG